MESNPEKVSPSIMVVDDIPANLVAMEHLLQDFEITLIKASNGYDALAETFHHDFALVLLDVQMPEIDGFQTARMMRTAEHSRRVPIIFVTANHSDEDHILKGYEAGGIDYITKPVSSTILRCKIKLFIALYEQRAELDYLNRSLLQAHDEVERATSAKSEFLANISHELRTPMHSILGFSELGIERSKYFDNGEELRENFKEIHGSAKRLLALLNDLLDLSKLEANAMKFDFSKSNLAELVSETVTSLRTRIHEKGQEVTVSKSDLDLAVEIDTGKIRQVLLNLLSNAIKFTPEGRKITVGFEQATLPEGRRKNDQEIIPAIAVSVGDEGIGIPEDELELIFDKFIQSGKTKDGAGGTGLGLAICREIISGHFGEIKAENNKANGTTMTFTIPLKQPIREKRNII